MELGQYPVVAVPDSGKIIDRAATTSSLKNPSPIAKHPMTTYASCGIVHVLRCTECGFESIVRDRFDTHSPCAGNIESYLLYTCSRCGGSSTSQTLMNEHAEFCHPDLSFLIEESVQKFRARGTDIDRTCSSSPNKSHKTLQTTPSTSTATHSFHPSSSADPRQSQGHGGSRLTERTMGRSNEALANDSYLNSFLEMINYFGSYGKHCIKDTSSFMKSCTTGGIESPACTNELTCPMCNQPVGSSIDELAKHLVLVHLVPFPSVLTFLSTSMLTNQLSVNREIQHLSSTCPPNLEWESTQTPMSTIAMPSVMSASGRSSEKSLKREHSPTDSVNKYNKPPAVKRTESMPIHYETKPGSSGYFTCPQCTAGFSSVYHLQLHFIQDHAMEFGNVFNLSAALAGTTRLSQPFPPQLLAQFSNSLAVPTSMANTCIPRPTFASLMEHATNVSKPDTLPDILARPIRSEENRRLESEASSITGPFGAASSLMNIPFAAAAAAAFGLPFMSDYPVTSSQSRMPESCNTPTQATLQGYALTGLRNDRSSEFQSKNNIGSTHANSKRSRMEASSMETTSSHPSDSLLNGPTLSDISIPWLNGTYPWPTDNGKPTGLAAFLTNCTQPKIPEFSSSSLFKPNIPTNSLPQTNFPLPEGLNLLPSLCSPVHRTNNNSQFGEKNQSDHGLSNGAHQGDLSTSTHTSRSSPPNPFLWPKSSQPLKSETQKRDHTGNDSDTSGYRPRGSSKGPTTVSGLDKPVPEVVVTTSNVDNPITAPNGAVHNTLRKTRSDMKVIHRYLVQVKHDNRDIQQIPYYELDQYIQDFVLTAKKKDGHEYEPESLKAFVHSLERHLKYHDYPHSVLKGSAFTGTRAVLNQRLNELRALSRSGGSGGGQYGASPGGYKRSSEDHSEVEGNTSSGVPSKRAAVARSFTPAGLVQGGLLGKDNPQAILNSLWLINRTQFNIGGTQRHRNLVWGQFQLVTDELGVKAVKFTPLFESAEVRYCRGHGGAKGCGSDASGRSSGSLQTLSCTGAAKRQPLPFNCVELFELYANLRPPEARGVSEPFYLCPEPTWEQSGNWFKTNAAGSQLLSRIPRLLGLKPAREPMLTSTTAANLEQPLKDPYDLAADTNICSRGAQSTSYFSGLSDAMLGKALFAKQQMHAQQQQPASSSFPSVYPPIPPNFLNLFPFVLPPGSEPLSAPLTQQSYLIPPSTYSNLLAPNSTLLFPQKSAESGHLSQAKSMKTTFPLEQHEADDLSHTGASSYRKYEKQLPAVDQQCGSPRSQSEPYVNAPSSDGSPSPTDAENLSLSDTSPRLPVCSILDTVSSTQTIYCPHKSIEKLSDRRLNQIENYSPQTSTDSHSSLSRPQSTGSRHSPVLGASSECSVRTDGNVTPERSSNLELHEHASGQSACLTPKEVLNLAHCKQEGSSCA